MKILITSAHSIEGETGSALVAHVLAKELSKKNKVLFLKLGASLGKQKVTNNLTYLNIPYVNLNGLIVPIISSETIKFVNKELSKFNPDVVHAQNIIFGGLLALIWANKNNIPYIQTFHAPPHEGMVYVYPNLGTDKFLSGLDRKFTKWYIGNYLDYVDMVIALNKVIVNALKLTNSKSKFTILNNGVDIKKFNSLRITNPNEDITFIYPGSYMSRKNQLFLIKTFRYLPKNWTLNLYGNLELGSGYVKKIKRLITKFNMDNVNLNDYITEEKLLDSYEKSSYLISASVKEVQSLVIIEALAAGKPIIALRNETTDDVLDKSTPSLIVPKNITPQNFSKKIKIFVEKSNKNYIKYAHACKVKSDEYDIKNIANQTIKIYKNSIYKNNPKKQNYLILKIFLGGTIVLSLLSLVASQILKLGTKLKLSIATD